MSQTYEEAIASLKQAVQDTQDATTRIARTKEEAVQHSWREAHAAKAAQDAAVAQGLKVTVAMIARDAGYQSPSHVSELIKAAAIPVRWRVAQFGPEAHYHALKQCGGNHQAAFEKLQGIHESGGNVLSELKPGRDFGAARRVLVDPDKLLNCLASFKVEGERLLAIDAMREVLIKQRSEVTDADQALAQWASIT